MKIYYFKGEICLKTPLHIDSGEAGDFMDSLVQRDSYGRPFIPGTSLCGLMASIAKDRLRLAGAAKDRIEEEPVFIALFGTAGKEGKGHESRLVVLDAIPKDTDEKIKTFIQDRTSIDRDRGSAMEDHLFHDELVPADTRFIFRCEFREKETTDDEADITNAGRDPNKEAIKLLTEILELLPGGYYPVGGKAGTGNGWFVLESLKCFTFDRQDPDDVIDFVLSGPEALEEKRKMGINLLKDANIFVKNCRTTINQLSIPETLIISGILRPLEPILVRAGYTTDVVNIGEKGSRKTPISSLNSLKKLENDDQRNIMSIDSAFCLYNDSLPYIPGSSIRGCLRSYAERMIRTFIYERFKSNHQADDICRNAAWDIEKAKVEGKNIAAEKILDFNVINERACIVSRLFGYTALGGRLYFSDALPVDRDRFKAGLKLLDHVAIDRFTGGSASGKKFNSMPFFPSYPDGVFPTDNGLPGDSGDMKFKVVLHDFESWHLGLVALLLKDLLLGNIKIGYGTRKGFGKIKLLKDIRIEGLTYKGGILEPLVKEKGKTIGGFWHIPETVIKSGTNFWLSSEEPLYEIICSAVKDFQDELKRWKPKEEPAGERK
ncbi:MAG: RAMP superfamily CRISPR-associated protein [Nitrospirota bacterium]